MKAIWKYPLDVIGLQRIEMPAKAEILTVQMQGDTICLWALVEPSNDKTKRGIFIIGTGHSVGVDELGRYVGTFQINGGALVFHVFENAP